MKTYDDFKAPLVEAHAARVHARLVALGELDGRKRTTLFGTPVRFFTRHDAWYWRCAHWKEDTRSDGPFDVCAEAIRDAALTLYRNRQLRANH